MIFNIERTTDPVLGEKKKPCSKAYKTEYMATNDYLIKDENR